MADSPAPAKQASEPSAPRKFVVGQKIAFWFLVVTCLASLIATIAAVRTHSAEQAIAREKQIEYLQEITLKGAEKINGVLKKAMDSSEKIAKGITSGTLNREEMLDALITALRENPHADGGTITFRPYRFDPRIKLQSFYFTWKDGALQQSPVDYDYTTSEFEWYVKPMEKGNRWSEPFWDPAGETYMTTYSAVFDLTDPVSGETSRGGVVTIDISMDEIRRVIKSLDIGSYGFGALTNSEGTYLYHPNDRYVSQKKNLRDLAEEKEDQNRLKLAKAAKEGSAGVLDHISTSTGQKSWLVFEPVPISGWSLQNTFIKEDLVESLRIRRDWMLIFAVATIFLIAFFALLFRVEQLQPRRIWHLSTLISLILIVNIGLTWWLALAHGSNHLRESGLKTSNATLESLINSHNALCESRNLPPPTYIPTGIEIETIELDNMNGLVVGGSIWQRYSDATIMPPADSRPPFQIAESRSSSISEIGRKSSGREQIIFWQFRAVVRQRLDASAYPLDQEFLTLRIQPLELIEKTALVPDLGGYKLLMRSSKPGIGENASLPGWSIQGSSFELLDLNSSEKLGLERSVNEVRFPTLHYKISIRRDFIDSFLSNLTPLILVAVMLFAILLLAGEMDYSRALSICVGMLFVIVFSHVRIRDNISPDHIFYLEYFYFIIYAAILWVALNAILTPLGLKLPLFEKKNRLLTRVLYWPFLLSVLSIVTFFTFYFEGD